MVSAEAAAAPGQLSQEGRAAATVAAIRLLGTYFADAPTWELEQRGDVASGEALDDDLARALRLRVALAAARRLDPLLRDIAADLSFRYKREARETVGMVRGRLDVQRYLRSQGKRQAPRRYPVTVVERSHATAENILMLYATGWVLTELEIGDLALPKGAPELREMRERRDSLARTLTHPLLAEARSGAEAVWRAGGLPNLLDRVEGRIEGGHLARPEPYAALADWVRTFDPETLPESGEVEWSFYDERFDTKLFEIWMLDRLERALAPKLGSPVQRPLWDRGGNATFVWKRGLATVGLHFQRSLGSSTQGLVWQRTDAPGTLDGVPDITVVVSSVRSGESLAYVDAKLRQRDQPPTEELYKLLGYFDNTGSGAARRGAIVYYRPGSLKVESYADQGAGRMLALGVDPSSADHEAGFEAAAELILEMLTASDPDALEAPAGEEFLTEPAVAATQEKAVNDLLLRGQTLAPGSLEPFRQLLATQIPETWPRLDADIQTILVTAEYFGAVAPASADLSGPLLGLSAACERLLCAQGMLFDRVAALAGGLLYTPVTLGTAAMCVKWCKRPREGKHQAIQGLVRSDGQIDYGALLAVRRELFDLNDLRKAAAHTELVTQSAYTDGRALILGSGERTTPGLLTRLVQALGLG